LSLFSPKKRQVINYAQNRRKIKLDKLSRIMQQISLITSSDVSTHLRPS